MNNQISDIYINKAKEIRKNFSNLSEQLLSNYNKLEELLSSVNSKIPDLENVEKKLNTGEYKDKNVFEKEFNETSILIEKEIEKISNIYMSLNTELDSLKNEEEALYQNIVATYPKLTIDEIRNIIKENVLDVE